MSSSEIQDLLRQGIEAARSGDRAQARDLLQQVVDQDEKNEKGWFWLASVVESEEERRVCLNNVLHINPNNEKARQAMDAIEAKARKKANAEEVAPGITRGALTLIVGGGVLVIIVIVVAFAAIVISNNNAAAAARAEDTRVASERTITAATATQGALNVTQTFEALATDTPAVTATSDRPTLPPTWTTVPTATGIPTAAPLAPVSGLNGFIGGYSGRDVLNNGYLSVGYYNLNQGGTFIPINTQYGRDVSFTPNGQRLVYARYDQLTFSSVLETINVNGTNAESIDISSAGVPIINPLQPRYSDNGQLIAFVARSTGTTFQLFVYDLLDNSMRQITNDTSEYSFPDVSPDGSRIAVIRDDVNSATPGADIVIIDITSGGQVPLTNDKGAYIESMPRWLDSDNIVYSVAASTDPENYDLFYRPANGGGTSLPFTREPGSERYPVVSPDGQHIAFASNRTGDWDIYIYTIATNSIAQLTQSPELDYPTDWWQP